MSRASQVTRIGLCISAMLFVDIYAQAGPVLRNLVSINICSDQFLLALANRDQISALSFQARDEKISYLAGQALGFPRIHGASEDLLNVDAGLVLMGPYDKRYVRQLLRRRNIPVLTVDTWRSFAGGLDQIRMIGMRLGQSGRAGQLIETINAAMNVLAKARQNWNKPPTFIMLQRRGYILRTGIVSELLRTAGLKDASRHFTSGVSGIVSLEDMVRYRPDYIVVEEASSSPQDQGEAKLVHPALLRLYPPARRLVIPVRLAICSGPSTPALIHHIAAEISRKTR
ncbi:MAG: ABC transporter substrate-binding protein [Beijerinckiaceae bacterium]|nr:ABC transporter substrate-binding protein [Beijerinckiaceae bacterium]